MGGTPPRKEWGMTQSSALICIKLARPIGKNSNRLFDVLTEWNLALEAFHGEFRSPPSP
jgi:hypothetical protein